MWDTPHDSARQVSGTWPTDRRFTGQRLEAGVGLYDYPLRGPPLRSGNARYYSPVLARFISPDSIVPRPEDPQALNRYAYVRHNPLRFVDPDGHAWKDFLLKLGKVALGAFTGAAVSVVSEATVIAIESKIQGNDLTVSDMAKHENSSRLIAAGVGGGMSGAFLGLTEGKGGVLGIGAASILGGQLEALAKGVLDERAYSGRSPSPARAVERAAEQGFLDFGTAARDFAAGVVAGKVVDWAYALLNRAAGQTVKEVKQIESFNPISKKPEVTVVSRSGPKQLSPVQRAAVIATQRMTDYLAEASVRLFGGQE